MRKFFVIGLLVIVLMSLLALPALAFEADKNGMISADQVIDDDLFIESQKVVVDGTINGDLFVNGSEIIINGPVNGNLLIFAAVAEVNGPVSGSVVFAGQSLALAGEVQGSVYGTGASLTLLPGARLGRNVYFAGYSFRSMPGSFVAIDVSLGAYQAALQGEIGRNVVGGLSALEIDGLVGGDVDVTVDPPESGNFSIRFGERDRLPDVIPSGIRISKQAVIEGKLNYVSTVAQNDTIALPPAQVTYRTLEIKEKLSPAEALRKRTLSAVEEFVTLLIMGAVALWLLPGAFQKSVQVAGRKPLPALGWGFVIFLLFVPLALLLGAAITMGAILFGVITLNALTGLVIVGGYLALALAVLIFLVLAFYGSKLVIASALGTWLLQRFLPAYRGRPFWPLLLGLVIYFPISLLPLPVEALFVLLVSLVGLGAMWIAYRQRHQPADPPMALAPAASGETGDDVVQ